MSKQIEALKRWVEVFDGNWHDEPVDSEWADRAHQALAEMRQAIAEAEQPAQQEPVAMRDAIVVNLVREGINKHRARELADHFIGLAPPQPPAQPLTDEQITKCWGQVEGTRHGYVAFARAIEAAHGITKGNT